MIDVLAESKSITELKLRADGERGASPAADARALAEILKRNQSLETPVSYTHLTLPTILLV